jgi:hypothetical protein
MQLSIISNDLSQFIVDYKDTKNFTTFKETIEDILETKIFNFLTYSNISKFLTHSLKEQLFNEYKQCNLIKKEYVDDSVKPLF